MTIFPNKLQNQNVVPCSNITWVMDLTTISLQSQKTLHIFICLDIYSNEVITFLCSESPITSKRICKALQIQLKTRMVVLNSKNKLILHSDRGSQFTSHIYEQFIHFNKDLIQPSMSRQAVPKDNSVCERYIRTLKNCKLNNLTLQQKLNLELKINPHFKQFRFILTQYIQVLNSKPNRKVKHPILDGLKSKVALSIRSKPLYTNAFSSNFSYDPRRDYIENFKKENQNLYNQMEKTYIEIVQKTPFDSTNVLNNNLEQSALDFFLIKLIEIYQINQAKTSQQLDNLQEHIDKIDSNVEHILYKLQKEKQKSQTTLPLRAAIDFKIYKELILNAGLDFKHNFKYKQAQLQILYVICYYTGCRVNEAASLQYKDIQDLLNTKKITLIHHKTANSVVHVVPDCCVKELNDLSEAIHLVFIKFNSNYLFGRKKPQHPRSVIRTVNRDIKATCQLLNINLNIKSHSFRVGFITKLIKELDILQASQIVGHKSINSTIRYNRYVPNSQEIRTILNKVFTQHN